MKSLWIAVLSVSTATLAMAQERGRVISVTPVTQVVTIPEQSCRDETVAVAPQPSGAGAVLGAVAGGVLGNAIGHGGGRAAATAAGAIGGAILGNQVESSGPPAYQVQRRCTTQTFYQNRAVAYDVVYEYAGRQYSTRTTTPPGDWIALSVQPAANSSAYSSNGSYDSDMPPQAAYATQPAAPTVIYQNEYYTPAPVYVAPSPNYVAPMLIGAGIAAGTYYASRPYYGPRYYGGYNGSYRHSWRR
ncbi:glycine zipper 2TM domain-containing protein [Comamonas composti]|uniref:glycine zipper 2TM domain-containing protein n=1 Tax=Comamonas composti TaxID=408558 RepID=UPI0003F80173|nr:glycine zipper 2TM domain-containing protein [Comamonas composti]